MNVHEYQAKEVFRKYGIPVPKGVPLLDPKGAKAAAQKLIDETGSEVHWLGTIDVGSLKIKVASTIVAISSIHLLQIFLNHSSFTPQQLMWLTIMHLAFVVSALILAYIDRITAMTKGGKKPAEGDLGL